MPNVTKKEQMSNTEVSMPKEELQHGLNEITKVEEFDLELARRTGAFVPTPTTILPRLSVNRDPEVGPMGQYVISQRENDETKRVFGKIALFRPFINAYQYQEYDGKANEFVNRSVIIYSFNEEAHDEKGGLACGKIKRDLHETLPADEQRRQANIKCNRLMYGLVTLKGETEEIEDLPVLFKLAGTNFMAPKDALNVITKAKHQYTQHYLMLNEPIRKKQGSTIYYEIPISVDMSAKLNMTSEAWDTLGLFEEIIERENGFILSKWRAAKKSVLGVNDKDLLKSLELSDEIPF